MDDIRGLHKERGRSEKEPKTASVGDKWIREKKD